MSKVTRKIGQSKRRFQNIVWPEIKHWFGSGELIAGETVNERVATLLDTEAGVDFYQVRQGEGVITLASRVQTTQCFRTHTARYDTGSEYDTEVQKRLRQLELGMLSPQFTIQAYVQLDDELEPDCVTGKLRNAAAVHTPTLYQYIDETSEGKQPTDRVGQAINGGWYLRRNTADGNIFLCVPWTSYAKKYDIRVRYRSQADLPPPPATNRQLGKPWCELAVGCES